MCRGEKLWPPDAAHPADLPLYATFYRDHVKLYRDMAGESLHRRGYRAAMHRASLNESAAAGLLTLAGWPKQQTGDNGTCHRVLHCFVATCLASRSSEFGRLHNSSISVIIAQKLLIEEATSKANAASQRTESIEAVLSLWWQTAAVLADPMCGSGTFLVEAALMAKGRAPGFARPVWPFQSWPDHNRRAWGRIRSDAEEAEAATPSFEGRLLGNDMHVGSLALAMQCVPPATYIFPTLQPRMTQPGGMSQSCLSPENDDWGMVRWRARFKKSTTAMMQGCGDGGGGGHDPVFARQLQRVAAGRHAGDGHHQPALGQPHQP